jgi:hypothetical protein
MKPTPSLLRLASTHHGMRRILKRPIPAVDFIRKAVMADVYRREPKKKTRGEDDRKDRDVGKFTLPPEYEILVLNPPVPTRPRMPKKFLRQEELKAARKDKTGRFVKNYLSKHDVYTADASVDDYYRKLLGIAPPTPLSAMGQKSSLLNKAYVVAVKQQQLLRSNSALTEQESLQIVEDLLHEEAKKERVHSRKVQQNIREWKHSNADNFPHQDFLSAIVQTSENSTYIDTEDEASLPSVLHSKPRTIQGIAIWSKRLQAIPYKEWTVGASVALDHFIALSILGVSDETWDALLEGSDPSLKSIAQDIAMTRRSLFPETVTARESYDESTNDDFINEVDDREAQEMEASIDELLKSLGGFDDGQDETVADDVPNGAQSLQSLREDLQKWRAKHMENAFNSWSSSDRSKFNSWLKNYVEILQGDDLDDIDWAATRDALLAIPPTTEDESQEFWDSIRDQTQAEIFLENLSPNGNDDSLQPFWNLSYAEKVRRMTALGSLRPILDEYADPEQRRAFLDRHADKLLEGLDLEHIVQDPNGPITGSDLQKLSSVDDVDASDRFSIRKLPYGSDEKGRLLLKEWNLYKANRARYEELLFKQGKLGLRYNDRKNGVKKKR